MKTSKTLKLLLCLVLCIALVASMAACGSNEDPAGEGPEKITIRVGSGQTPEGYTWIRGITEILMPTVDAELAKTGNYEIDWVEAWGGSVCAVTDCLEAVQDGLLDMSLPLYVFEQAKLPYGNITYFAPFAIWDVQNTAAVYLEFVEKSELIANEYDQYGQFPLGYATGESYNFTTTFEYTGFDSLKGMRAGAAGSNLSWITEGVTPIQSGGPDAYNALQTGLYEMALQPTSFHKDLFLYEVAPYGLIADLGSTWMGGVTINTEFFNGLPEEVQNALLVGGQAYTDGLPGMTQEGYDTTMEFLEENCEKVVYLTDEERQEWAAGLENVPLNYVLEKEAEGLEGIRELMLDYLETVKQYTPVVVRDWAAEF